MGISNQASGLKPGVCTSTTRPTTPYVGQMIFETDTNKLLIHNGTSWIMISDTDSPPGMVLVKSQAISGGVTSVTLTNVFSSEFDSYRVMYSGGTLSVNDISARFGPTSVSGYNTGYYSTLWYVNGNPGTASVAQTTNVGEMNWIGGGGTTSAYVCFDVIGPYTATWSRFHSGAYQNNLSVGHQTGEHRSTGQFTDITIIGGGGATITGGTVRVYGYRNSI